MGKSVIKSVSISREQEEYLQKYPKLSLSSILQTGIEQIKINRKCFEDQIRVLENRLNVLQQKLFDSNEFITDKGLWEEFKNVVDKKN